MSEGVLAQLLAELEGLSAQERAQVNQIISAVPARPSRPPTVLDELRTVNKDAAGAVTEALAIDPDQVPDVHEIPHLLGALAERVRKIEAAIGGGSTQPDTHHAQPAAEPAAEPAGEPAAEAPSGISGWLQEHGI